MFRFSAHKPEVPSADKKPHHPRPEDRGKAPRPSRDCRQTQRAAGAPAPKKSYWALYCQPGYFCQWRASLGPCRSWAPRILLLFSPFRRSRPRNLACWGWCLRFVTVTVPATQTAVRFFNGRTLPSCAGRKLPAVAVCGIDCRVNALNERVAMPTLKLTSGVLTFLIKLSIKVNKAIISLPQFGLVLRGKQLC